MSLARLFVDVPMSVSVSPSIDANDSGSSSFEGAVFPSCARSAITGIRIATTGVLLTNLVRLIQTDSAYLRLQAREEVNRMAVTSIGTRSIAKSTSANTTSISAVTGA
jgi:hypothetical protein